MPDDERELTGYEKMQIESLDASKARIKAERNRVRLLLGDPATKGKGNTKKPPPPRTAAEVREREKGLMPIYEHGVYQGAREVDRVVDTVTAMWKRKQLSRRQWLAADKYRDAWDAMNTGSPCALDMERMGGGSGGGSPTDEQMWGAGMVASAERTLGVIDGRIVRLVVGEGRTVAEAAEAICGLPPSRAILEHYGRRFRDGLDVLASMWIKDQGGREIRGTGKGLKFDPALAGTDEAAVGKVAHAGPDGIRRK